MNISVLVKDGKRCEDSVGSPDSNSEQLLNLSGLPDGLPDIKSHQFYQQVRSFRCYLDGELTVSLFRFSNVSNYFTASTSY